MNEVYRNGSIEIHYENKYNSILTLSYYTEKDIDGEKYFNITEEWSEDENNTEKTEINGVIKQTSKTGEINKISFNKYIEKYSNDESWFSIDGGIGLESKCATGNYQFKTIEKLVEAKDGSENVESGILNINEATYTFENQSVTIKTPSEEETLLQSELEKEMESDSCN